MILIIVSIIESYRNLSHSIRPPNGIFPTTSRSLSHSSTPTTAPALLCTRLPLPFNFVSSSSASGRFLVEGPQGAVLHTGDFRAEPWFLQALARNPLIQRYLSPLHFSDLHDPDEHNTIACTLDAIYLDTACALSETAVPTKVRFEYIP